MLNPDFVRVNNVDYKLIQLAPRDAAEIYSRYRHEHTLSGVPVYWWRTDGAVFLWPKLRAPTEVHWTLDTPQDMRYRIF